MVVLSVYFFILKWDGLQFHPHDYNYFVEQAARLASPLLSNTVSFNVNGYNFLNMRGIEGVKGVYQAIHAEWFRYSYVLLYWIFTSTVPIYIWYSLIFFFPMVYFALLVRSADRDAWKQVLLFCLLFVLFPGVINTVTFDLRPRALFFAAWTLVILAVYYERPFWEKLVFFCLLLGIREEGILFGAIVIVFNFVRMHGKKDQWKQTLIFLALDVAAFAVFLWFMSVSRQQRAHAPRRNIRRGRRIWRKS